MPRIAISQAVSLPHPSLTPDLLCAGQWQAAHIALVVISLPVHRQPFAPMELPDFLRSSPPKVDDDEAATVHRSAGA